MFECFFFFEIIVNIGICSLLMRERKGITSHHIKSKTAERRELNQSRPQTRKKRERNAQSMQKDIMCEFCANSPLPPSKKGQTCSHPRAGKSLNNESVFSNKALSIKTYNFAKLTSCSDETDPSFLHDHLLTLLIDCHASK